jgi:transcriptional regulator with XRE-family HTH domain
MLITSAAVCAPLSGDDNSRCCFRESVVGSGAVEPSTAISDVLAEVGPRLRRVRTQRDVTLTELAAATGISKSTLSRLESGQRKPSLELLLPIAQAHRIPLDELVGAPQVGDPRIRLKPERRGGGRIVVPLTRQPRAAHAWKVVIPPERGTPKLRSHEGYEWLYVLAGALRLVVADHDITMGPGEVAEFDTKVPHWFGAAGDRSVEILSILSREGERIHVRAAPPRTRPTGR